MLGVVQLELKIVNELVKHHPLGITLQILSNSLILLNTTNCNVDKRNSDFDPHENEKKIVCLNVIVVESLQQYVV